jgi:hypothetical protein
MEGPVADKLPSPQGRNDPYRRRFDYSPEAKLYVPPSMRENPPPRRTAMTLKCPKCGKEFGAPKEYHIAICVADAPPFVGDGRGCGWLLQLEPPHSHGTHGKANAIMDCKPDPATCRFPDPRTATGWEERVPLEWVDGTGAKRFAWNVRPGPLRVEAYRRALVDWQERGLMKIHHLPDGRLAHEFPTVNDLPSGERVGGN